MKAPGCDRQCRMAVPRAASTIARSSGPTTMICAKAWIAQWEFWRSMACFAAVAVFGAISGIGLAPAAGTG
ncbi:hypothetical protein [Cupriavidus taiwanensis]|uniref:hypothetical protein n=1 Tax=Cupriavidus taiwanensis TaxID=164546 RepID=UPI0012FF0CBF|nr:hypothetical protein [Cupriavidus taiwanensis]